MTDYRDTEKKLEEYSQVFDFYMERGELPETADKEDCLTGYIKEVIENNPDINGKDEVWVEVLKDDLMGFFAVLLEKFREMQLAAEREMEKIRRFRMADIEGKRGMWKDVCGMIRGSYSQAEVNLEGYTKQFQTEDKEAVFAALTDDWEKACMERMENGMEKMLKMSRQRFMNFGKGCGREDYEDIKKLNNYIHRFPQLKEIVDMIGRDKKSDSEEKDEIIHKFLPQTVAKIPSIEEIDRVEEGDNLSRVLPTEFAMHEDLFFKRFAMKELQQFSSPGKDKPKKVEEKKKTPRLDKGPIVVAIDTSGSMSGQPEKIAFSLLKQLLRMAKKQKRNCFLIDFSVRAKSIDLSRPNNWKKVDDFLKKSFSGGTDGEQMFGQALKVLKKGTYEMADVLVISDFEFPLPLPKTKGEIEAEQGKGTRFYGLQIGHRNQNYKNILDRIWKI